MKSYGILALIVCGVFALMFGAPRSASAQTGVCSSGGCGVSTSLWPSNSQTTTSTSFVTVPTSGVLFAGDYGRYNVTSGQTYEWSLCSGDGGSVSYDSTLTLRTDTSPYTALCFNDDLCCFCVAGANRASKIRWTATSNGTVRVQVNAYVSPTNLCGPNSTPTTLVWRCETCASTPTITSVSPSQPVATGVRQPFTITGTNFSPTATVDLEDLTASQSYPNRTVSSRTGSTSITIDPNFGTAIATGQQWRVRVNNGTTPSLWFPFTVVPPPDTTPPTISVFDVTPASHTVILGGSFTISYTVSDSGGSGLNRIELWGANGNGTNWHQIGSATSLSGNGPRSGTFTDAPSPAGSYLYGIHVLDNANPFVHETTPIQVTVTLAADFGGNVTSSVGGTPVSGASVCWGSDCRTTDVNGRYDFASVPCESRTLTVSRTGYQTYSATYTPVCLSSNLPRNVVLTPSTGACCTAPIPMCAPTTQANCPAGGIWTPGVTCAAVLCPSIEIVTASLSASTVLVGPSTATITLNYDVRNPYPRTFDLGLGGHMKLAGVAPLISDTAHDAPLVTIQANQTAQRVSRQFTVPAGTVSGPYTMTMCLWSGQPGSTTSLSCMEKTLAVRRPVFGTTIITHGYTFFSSSAPAWTESMARAVLYRAGDMGTVYRYRPEDGRWAFVTSGGRGSSGEIVLIFNWAAESDQSNVAGTQGTAEGAADALYAALRDPLDTSGNRLSNVLTRGLHFIGHSRGASVNSDVIERLGAAGVTPASLQVTTLDPHPVNGTLSSGPILFADWGDHDPTTWNNVGFADNYFHSIPSCGQCIGSVCGPCLGLPFDLVGMQPSCAVAVNHDLYALNPLLNPCGAHGHEAVHVWYHGTIDMLSSGDGSCTLDRTTWYPVGFGSPSGTSSGYSHSLAAGGTRPSVGMQCRPTPRASLPLAVYNGDVRLGQSQYAGWAYHGGSAANAGLQPVAYSGSGPNPSCTECGYFRFGIGESIRHNRFYIEPSAQTLKLQYRMVGTAWTTDRLVVKLEPVDPNLGGVITLYDGVPPAASGWTPMNLNLSQGVGGHSYTLLIEPHIGFFGATLDVADIRLDGSTPVPAAPTSAAATPSSSCSGGTTTLTASVPSGITVDWYSGSCFLGNYVGTGTSVSGVQVTTTTQYFARARDPATGATSSACAGPVTVSVVPPPATPAVGLSTTICAGTSGGVSGSAGAGEVIDWYTTSCGDASHFVGTGTSLSVTPSLTTIYYARTRNTTTGCVSASCATVTVTVIPLPGTPVVGSPSTICSGASATINATPGSGGDTVYWYTISCGGTSAGVGNTLSVTPSITTVYYARTRNTATECFSAGCSSVTVTVQSCPNVACCSANVCTSATAAACMVSGGTPQPSGSVCTPCTCAVLPTIANISNASIQEPNAYTGPTPSLTQGTLPISWSLVASPSGMTINASSGVVTWSPSTATASPYTITIRATNCAGANTKSWSLTVVPEIVACCATTGACTPSTTGACSAAGNTPQAAGSVCTPSPCVGQCCSGSGACSTTAQASCPGVWTTGGACAPTACICSNSPSNLTVPQQLVRLSPQTGDRFGWACATDSTSIVVGARFGASAAGTGTGAAFVYQRGTNGVWTTSPQQLSPQPQTDPSGTPVVQSFGNAVGVSGDHLLIAARWATAGGVQSAGVVYAFRRVSGVWQYTQTISAPVPADSGEFGHGLGLDGDYAIVGSLRPDATAAGAAYVFHFNGTLWVLDVGGALVAPDATPNRFFGLNASISGDTAIVGAFNYSSPTTDDGAAYVFRRGGSGWVFEQRLQPGFPHFGAAFGDVVKVQGNQAIIGATNDTHLGMTRAGAAYIFTRTGSVWTQEAELVASDDHPFGLFGYYSDINGQFATVGGIGFGTPGAAYVFKRTSAGWRQADRLIPAARSPDDRFGYGVAMSDTSAQGAFIVVAGYGQAVGAVTNAGAVAVFDLRGLDCNDNGVPDYCDIQLGTLPDLNNDGIPDGCTTGSPCPADFNRSGTLSAQDIFDFLGAWFALDPRADFNGVNGQNAQDIFDFLGAWFAGCP